jgi:adenosylcobinamide-GDP ribazoletransferase
MRTILQTIAVAFSMYSAIPMPQFEWTPRNMRGAMMVFPFIGVVIGLLVWLWAGLCDILGWSSLLFAAGIVAIPVLVTGGIHLDGLCDTHDALASHAERDRKLEIMKDSHTGAFAVIAIGVYLVCYLGFASELENSFANMMCLLGLYILSRCGSAFAVATFPCAKNSGLVHTFADMAARRTVRNFNAMFAVLISVALMVLFGTSAVMMVACVLIVFVIYRTMSDRLFGGITGDLAGWFLQYAEIAGLVGLVIAQSAI